MHIHAVELRSLLALISLHTYSHQDVEQVDEETDKEACLSSRWLNNKEEEGDERRDEG